jgi:hypothetical protein
VSKHEPSALSRLLLGSSRSIAGTVYGTIVAMSVIAAGAGAADAGRLAGFVGSSAIVFWLAHVYAHGLEESIDTGHRLDWTELRRLARREAAIPLAALAPTVALTLGALGALRESRAIWLALGLGVATLGVQGLRYARLEALSGSRTAVVVALNLLLGSAIVALKAALSH